jgi:hypothetical protein
LASLGNESFEKPLKIKMPDVVVNTRVARWFVFKSKTPILVIFGVPWNGKCHNIL